MTSNLDLIRKGIPAMEEEVVVDLGNEIIITIGDVDLHLLDNDTFFVEEEEELYVLEEDMGDKNA